MRMNKVLFASQLFCLTLHGIRAVGSIATPSCEFSPLYCKLSFMSITIIVGRYPQTVRTPKHHQSIISFIIDHSTITGDPIDTYKTCSPLSSIIIHHDQPSLVTQSIVVAASSLPARSLSIIQSKSSRSGLPTDFNSHR